VSENIENVKQQKLLSLALMGRDDDYMPDFRYRITTTINHLARSIKNLGQEDKVEILVTDWGSLVPMAHTLELSPEAAEVCRFIYVPPDVIRDTQEGKDYFHTTRAANVAIRRACGRFILLSNADQIMQQHSLNAMLSLLDSRMDVPINVNRTLLMIPRLEVPWQFIERQPSLQEWTRYMLLNEYCLERAPVWGQNVLGFAGGFMLHRDIYYLLTGFDESYATYGWSDCEFGLRASQNFPFLWLSSIGVFMFHMGHPPTGGRQRAISELNTMMNSTRLQVNDNSWGLGDHELEVQQPRKIRSASNTRIVQDKAEQATLKRPLLFSGMYEQLQSRDVVQHVKKIVGMLVRNGQRIERKDLHALLFLSWYSIHHFPRRYVESGVLKGCGAVVVVAACPSVEVYLMDRWEGRRWVGKGRDPLDLAGMLYGAGLRGYIQFIDGEMSTAMRRLRDSFGGPFEFDLALIRGETLGTTAKQQICDLAHFMTTGSALILTFESASYFLPVWNELRQLFPKFLYLQCGDRKSGMVLSCSLSDTSSSASDNIEIDFAGHWFTLLVVRNKIVRAILKIVKPTVRSFTKALKGI